MKRPSWLHWPPQSHWTDDKIRVHAPICLWAATPAPVLRREVARGGIEVSLPGPLSDLMDVQEVLLEYPGRPRGADRSQPSPTTNLDYLQIPDPMAKPLI